MIVMLDTSQDLRECASELGVPVEQFHTPLTRYLPQYPDEHFAIDNGLFSPKCDIEAFRRLLDKHWERRELCRFVTAPDIVASARRTLEAFEFWKNELVGWMERRRELADREQG